MNRDLSRSRAILISNAVYQDGTIPHLPAAAGCVPAMREVLTSDICGWPASRVESFQDPAIPSELAPSLVDLVAGVEDLLLLYYVGHGIRTTNGQLALALRNTSAHPEKLPHTAILYKSIADILRASVATTKLVILDCCHAALANKDNSQFQSPDPDHEPVEGLYCIWASKEWEKAKSPTTGGLTHFTNTFIDVLHAGIGGKPAQLTIDQVYNEIRDRMLKAGLPEPVKSGVRDAGNWPFARNAAPAETSS